MRDKIKKRHSRNKQYWAIEALERDNYSCVKCFLSCEEVNILVHHLDESRKNGYKNMNNSLDNLMTLCKKCHAIVHGYTQDKEVKRRIIAKKLVVEDKTLQEIGDEFGISRQRVYQILWNGDKSGSWEEVRQLASV